MNRSLPITLALLLTTGCASITRGTTEAYVIETDPPGAKAVLSNGLTCTTPCSLKVKRRSEFTVVLSRAGYETVNANVTSSVDGAGAAGMAGNVLLGGIIGAGIDAGTGAMHSHKPNPLSVNMVKGEGERILYLENTELTTPTEAIPAGTMDGEWEMIPPAEQSPDMDKGPHREESTPIEDKQPVQDKID